MPLPLHGERVHRGRDVEAGRRPPAAARLRVGADAAVLDVQRGPAAVDEVARQRTAEVGPVRVTPEAAVDDDDDRDDAGPGGQAELGELGGMVPVVEGRHPAILLAGPRAARTASRASTRSARGRRPRSRGSAVSTSPCASPGGGSAPSSGTGRQHSFVTAGGPAWPAPARALVSAPCRRSASSGPGRPPSAAGSGRCGAWPRRSRPRRRGRTPCRRGPGGTAARPCRRPAPASRTHAGRTASASCRCAARDHG